MPSENTVSPNSRRPHTEFVKILYFCIIVKINKLQNSLLADRKLITIKSQQD